MLLRSDVPLYQLGLGARALQWGLWSTPRWLLLLGLSVSSLAGLALKTKEVCCVVRPDVRYSILPEKADMKFPSSSDFMLADEALRNVGNRCIGE